MNYYENLLKNYQAGAMQKTPQQLADEQQAQAYQHFLSQKEGIEAMNDLKQKFNIWFEQNYGVKQPVSSNEVQELKEMVSNMAKQIEALSILNNNPIKK